MSPSLQALLLLLVVAPLLEETVLRAGVHETLLRRARWTPGLINVLTAAGFGLAHMALRQDPQALLVALPALLIGLIYQRWRSLRWCVAAHAAMNGLWLLLWA
jgi:membrane protease YdiL (CAAX protease family)